MPCLFSGSRIGVDEVPWDRCFYEKECTVYLERDRRSPQEPHQILLVPEFDIPFLLTADASKTVMRVMLSQRMPGKIPNNRLLLRTLHSGEKSTRYTRQL